MASKPALAQLALAPGRSASCGARIAFRYFLVELLTALLFLAAWGCFPVAACDRLLGPDCAPGERDFHRLRTFHHSRRNHHRWRDCRLWSPVLAVPALMDQESRLMAILYSLGAAALGYGLLWLVLEGEQESLRQETVAAALSRLLLPGCAKEKTPSLSSVTSAAPG